MPRLRFRRAVLIVVPFIALAVLTMWLAVYFESQVLPVILFILPVIIGHFYYLYRRCPECRSRLSVRRQFIGGTKRYYVFLDCQRCQIAWDTGEIGDDSD